MSMLSPEQRFINHFDSKIVWGKSKTLDQLDMKEVALQHELSKYLLFPQSRRKYVGADLDYEASAGEWEALGLPEPTLSIVNRENWHSNLFWELETAVILPHKFNFRKVSMFPVKYFRAVQRGFTQALYGDFGYTNASIKNPFNLEWSVRWADRIYTLGDLAEYVELPNITRFFVKNDDDDYPGRNCELFHVGRVQAYKKAKDCAKYEEFAELLISWFSLYNNEIIPDNWPERGPLPEHEVRNLVHHIAKWVWARKADGSLKNYNKNLGVLGYDRIKHSLDYDSKCLITKARQSAGATYVHQLRKDSSESKVRAALEFLEQRGQKFNIDDIIRLTKLSHMTIRTYMKKLKNKE